MTVMPTSRSSILCLPAGGLKQAALIRTHRIETDQPDRAGGTDTAPSPLELLSASLGSCIALYLQKLLDANSLPLDGLAVEVKPLWRDNPGWIARFDVLVHVPSSIPVAFHAMIEEMARSCPVHHTLTRRPEVSLKLHTTDPVAAAAA